MLRKAVPGDVDGIVRVHLESFSGFFLTLLGDRFLGLYYRGVLNAPDRIAYVFQVEGEVAGFVVGSVNPRGFYSRLLKRDWYRFAYAAVAPVLRNPGAVLRVARAVRHPGRNPLGDHVAGLFSLGVGGEARGKGAGRQLVQAFLSEAGERGCRQVVLNTDRENNDRVNSFYQDLGFRLKRWFPTPEGRKMNEYWFDLAPTESGNGLET